MITFIDSGSGRASLIPKKQGTCSTHFSLTKQKIKNLIITILLILMPVTSQADNPTYATNEMCSILPSNETHVLAGGYQEHHEIAFEWQHNQGFDIWGQPCGELRYNTEFALDGYINGVITYRYTIVRNKCTGGRFRVSYKSRTLVTKSSGTWVTLFMSYPLRLLVLLHLC